MFLDEQRYRLDEFGEQLRKLEIGIERKFVELTGSTDGAFLVAQGHSMDKFAEERRNLETGIERKISDLIGPISGELRTGLQAELSQLRTELEASP